MSYRTDNGASYDRTLLSTVPDPTRAEKQEGYNVDLLDASRERRARSPTNDDHNGSNAMDYSPGATSYARKAEPNGHEPVVAKVPWYRTRRGIIIIVAIIIVIICAVVGGVVGGTSHSSKPKNDSSGKQNSGDSTQQAQGQASIPGRSSTTPLSASSTNPAAGPNVAGATSTITSGTSSTSSTSSGVALSGLPFTTNTK